MIIRPLFIPNVDWDNFNAFALEIGLDRPTKVADRKNLNLDDPATLVACSDMNNILRSGWQMSHNHIYIGFMFYFSDDQVRELCLTTALTITAGPKHDGWVAGILSGTLPQFDFAIKQLCVKDTQVHFREIGNALLLYLEQTGFKELWFGFHKDILPDKTFVLRIKK